jgi:hypothetical protein
VRCPRCGGQTVPTSDGTNRDQCTACGWRGTHFYFSSEPPGWMAYWEPGMSNGDAVRRMLATREAESD